MATYIIKESNGTIINPGVKGSLEFCKTAFKLIGTESVFTKKVPDGKKIRKNKREGLVHPSKSSKLKILTMSKVPEVAVERKSSAGHNVSLSRRMLLPMDDLDSLTLPL